ncbi:hypothetical protein LRS13_14580 [Svornostia abyssi]|uniref:Uncharacterized protein n=1 Tax=Svornostia abyssi TaxID=2898438 RepID=A0ABY5PB82_9ACTN|nr:hypothetical protein LRS13_14580 [Parviterribacteraceae bacterium J379]
MSLTREEAILYDAGRVVDTSEVIAENAQAGVKLSPSAGAEEWDPVFTIARWIDVHGARNRVVARRLLTDGVDPREVHLELVIVTLRSWGIADAKIAEALHVSESFSYRRFRGVVGDVLIELGGERAPDALMLERPADACLLCGQNPRARSARKVRVKRNGRRETVWKERQTSLCAQCLESVDIRKREVRGTMRELRRITT